ncbi:MAG: hypothetical protein AAGK79_21015, partial [Pseudomonadota bacterium]
GKGGEAGAGRGKHGGGKKGGGKRGSGPGPKRPGKDAGPRQYTARPEKKDKIDPDNPFAQALAGLKDKS